MKRLVAISFLFIFLFANTAFGQVLKMSTLIHHYIEHAAEDNDSSILDFLAKHYSKDINHPDDKHHDHQDLPFKTLNSHTLQVVSVVPQPNISIPQIISAVSKLKMRSSNKPGYSDAYLDSIFQPPRFS